ncbi:hypothetical protein ACN28E_33845 [Archangium lansingense]|uniref:hypothetical protein n=1 Tax=Archangium lansingense TaxID=2995310 RepID=UPI003B7A50C5
MKLWGSLSWRILVSAAVLGLLGTLGATYLAVMLGAQSALRAALRPTTELIMSEQGEACRSAPEGWFRRTSEGVEVEAFDFARVTRAGTSSGRPSPELLARMLQGEAQPVSFYFPLFNRKSSWGGIMLIRVADAGPCSLLEYRWPISSARASNSRWLFLAAVLITTAMAALSTFVVIHPLLQRLRRLHRSAGGLGSGGFVSAVDAGPDELGELSRVLDATHERVLADAARIEAQKHALERHLADVAHDLKTPIASLQLSLRACLGST